MPSGGTAVCEAICGIRRTASQCGTIRSVTGPLSASMAALKDRLGFDDLEEFGLLGDLDALRAAAAESLTAAGDEALDDRTACLALQAAIQRLDEPGVPREIQGQRLAAVITKCTEAVEWRDLPECAAAARACLRQRLRRAP